MRSVNYRGYDRHKEIHDTFRDQTLVSLKKIPWNYPITPDSYGALSGCFAGLLTGHIYDGKIRKLPQKSLRHPVIRPFLKQKQHRLWRRSVRR